MSSTSAKRIVILFGGRSTEHEISCIGAGAVLGAIDRSQYSPILVGITKAGEYRLIPEGELDLALNPDKMPVVTGGEPFVWPMSATDHTAYVLRDGGLVSVGEIDVVFPVLHGPWGEDGTVQGMLELIGLPYVGNGIFASSASMDKVMTKHILREAGIDVGEFVAVPKPAWTADQAAQTEAIAALGLPVFVKPARSGSSVGVSKVKDIAQLPAAMDVAFAEDSKVIVEAGVDAREVECGVLQSDRDGNFEVSAVAGEITVNGHEFYDYAAKYLDEQAATLTCPAELTPTQLENLRTTAAKAFAALDCRGLARIDFFVAGDRAIVNEVNTLPGFTPRSMYPVVWQRSGVEYPEVITRLIQLAE